MKRISSRLFLFATLQGLTAAVAAQPSGVKSPSGPASTATATTPDKVAAPAKAAADKPRGKTIDRVELDQTTITGNRELPNVMVIVPWKESLPGTVSPASRSLLEDALAPLDREEFLRELQYQEVLQRSPPTPSAAPSSQPENPSPK